MVENARPNAACSSNSSAAASMNSAVSVGSAVYGWLAILLAASMAQRWFGRGLGAALAVLATLLAVAGVTAAPDRPLDGISLIDVLSGRKTAFSRTV